MPKEKVNYLDYFAKSEEINIQKARKYFSKELEFWEENFDMLIDAFKLISKSYSEKWPHSKKASLFLLPRLIISTKTSLELLVRGYYFDYTVVQRSLWESLALFKFLSEDEEEAKRWLNFEKIELPKWKLMHRLLPSSRTGRHLKLLNKMYAQQSEFVHSSFFAIFSDWARQYAQRKRIFEFLKFQKSFVGDVLSTPLSLLIILMLVEVFREELEESFRMKAMNLAEGKISKWKANGLLKE